MFPFVFDHRTTIDPSLAVYHAAKRTLKHSTRGSSPPDNIKDSFAPPPSSYPSNNPPLYATRTSSSSGTGGGNSFRNPYAFVQPRASYSPSNIASSKRTSSTSTSGSSSSASSTKSRLAAINASYDTSYGSWDGQSTAEEIRASQQQSRHLKDIEAGVPSHPHASGRSSTSSTSSSSGSDEDTPSSSSSKRGKRRLRDRLLRRKKLSSDDEDALMDEDEGR